MRNLKFKLIDSLVVYHNGYDEYVLSDDNINHVVKFCGSKFIDDEILEASDKLYYNNCDVYFYYSKFSNSWYVSLHQVSRGEDKRYDYLIFKKN